MAADFTLEPSVVIPLEPEFNTIITQSESMKKQYQSLGSDGVRKFKILFKALTDANFWILHNHYYSAVGGYDSFSWTSVPSYIDTDLDGTPDGSNMTGRWVEKSFQFEHLGRYWRAEAIFEKAIS